MGEMASGATGQGRKPWYRKARWWLLLAAVTSLLVVVAGAQPLARYETRKRLNTLHGFHADFKDVHVSVLPLRCTITHLKLEQDSAPENQEPLLYSDRTELELDWHKLLHRKIVATVSLSGTKLSMVQPPAPKESKGTAKQPVKKAQSLGEQMQALLPLDIDRVEMKNCEFLYVMADPSGSHPKIWLHQVEATVENIATRANLATGTTTVALSGTLQKTGKLSVFATADPLEKQMTFAGQVDLKGLQLVDLDDFIATKAKMEPTRGTLDIFARFEARDGEITGGVKPVLKNPSVKSSSPNLWDKLKASVADAGLKLFSDRVPGRNAVATVIPIKGTVGKTDLQVWPTILGIIRNAFVQGLTESFLNLPPATSPPKDGLVGQARHAFSKKAGAPQAQPSPRSHFSSP